MTLQPKHLSNTLCTLPQSVQILQYTPDYHRCTALCRPILAITISLVRQGTAQKRELSMSKVCVYLQITFLIRIAVPPKERTTSTPAESLSSMAVCIVVLCMTIKSDIATLSQHDVFSESHVSSRRIMSACLPTRCKY